MHYMKRRDFITVLAGAAAWPLAARAQQPSPRRRPVLGYLITGTKVGMAYLMTPFLNRLREIGYNDGQNIDIVTRYADADITRLAVLADELVRSQPNVIVAMDPPAALAAKKATASLPIVAAILNDPMRLGLIASYARPGGNVTGILSQVEGLPGKHVEIARELFPTVAVIGVLVNPANATHQYQREEVEAAAAKSAIKVIAAEARSKADLDAAFRVFDSAGVRVAVVLRDFVFSSEFQSIAELATTMRLATIGSQNAPAKGRHYCCAGNAGDRRGEESNSPHFHRLSHRVRPGRRRLGRFTGATWGQYHRPIDPAARSCRQTARTLARDAPRSQPIGGVGRP
jgi:putative ABC transport system substrate-binding protein